MSDICMEDLTVHSVALDASLEALLRANTPALTELNLNFSAADFADKEAPYFPRTFGALAHNTHLRTLHWRRFDRRASFMRDTMLPAVRASTSLRELRLLCRADDLGADARSAVDEVQQLFAARGGTCTLPE
jgi:hypothetical protein